MTLHTSDGCTMEPATPDYVTSTDCGAPDGTGKDGCQQQNAGDAGNYGDGFNAADGGVYAMEWTDTDISVWFFPRDSVPSALGADASDVDSSALGTPMVKFVGGSGCSIADRFQDHSIVIDTTL